MSDLKLHNGDTVLFKNNITNDWEEGIFQGQNENGKYLVHTEQGVEEFLPSDVMKK